MFEKFFGGGRGREKVSDIAQRRWHPLVKTARERFGVDINNDIETARKISELETSDPEGAKALNEIYTEYSGEVMKRKEEKREKRDPAVLIAEVRERWGIDLADRDVATKKFDELWEGGPDQEARAFTNIYNEYYDTLDQQEGAGISGQ